MTDKKPVCVYIGIRVVLDFHSIRQGISVIIILRTEKLLHKKYFLYQCFCLYSTLHTIFILNWLDSLELRAYKFLLEDSIGYDYNKRPRKLQT